MFSITPTAYCISQGRNAICIISAPHIKRKWAERDDSLHRKTLCFQSKKIRSRLCFFISLYISICLIRLCVSSDGKWVDKLRQKRAKQAVSLSIYDIICPPDSSACHIGGTRIKEKNKTEGKNVLFFLYH